MEKESITRELDASREKASVLLATVSELKVSRCNAVNDFNKDATQNQNTVGRERERLLEVAMQDTKVSISQRILI